MLGSFNARREFDPDTTLIFINGFGYDFLDFVVFVALKPYIVWVGTALKD